MKTKIITTLFLATALVISNLLLNDYTINPKQKLSIDKNEIENAKILSTYLDMSLEEIKTLPKYDRPDLATLRDFEMTRDPKLGYIPSQKRIETFRKIQKIAREKKAKRAISGVNWIERGPNNIGGRTRALMFDPNDNTRKKVWAGSVSGGLWVNNDITNSNSQWQNVNDFWANIAVTSLAFDPSNTQIMYAGTGEGYFNIDAVRGAGIWKTTDGGQTWNQLASTNNPNFHYIQKIAITPGGSVFVATRNGVFRSQNKGSSWAQVLNGRASDIEITGNGIIYASLGIFSTGTVHKSTNFGNSWSNITPAQGGQRIEMAIAPTNNNVIYAIASSQNASVAWFRKSINGGSTWSNVTIPRYFNQNCSINNNTDFTRGQSWYDLILAVSPVNENRVLAGGIDIYRTDNGGSSWNLMSYWTGRCGPLVHADQHAITFRPQAPNEAIFGHDGGVSYSANIWSSSPSFNSRIRGYNVTQFYATDILNNSGSNFLLAGAQDNGTIRINTVGVSSGNQVTGGDGGFCHIDQDNASIQITAFTNNNINLSIDGGNSFTTVVRNNSGRFINPSEYDDGSNVLYTAAAANQYLRVNNLSNGISNVTSTTVNVNALNNRQISAIKASPYTGNRIFISNDQGRVLRVDNANTNNPNVTTISTNAIPSGYISCIELGKTDNEILITLSNYGLTSVYETTNGGASWSNKEGNLPDMPIRWALYNPKNTNQVLLATESGVWSTDNVKASTPNWGISNTGLANVRCDMLKYRETDGLVVVATHGRGLFTTNVFNAASPASDISGHWAENEISYMLNNRFMSGYSDGTFRPDQELTRAEYAAMISSVIDPPQSGNPQIANRSFNDISGHWAEQAILKTARAGYLAGYPDESFRPNNKITKAQMLVAVSNGLNLTGGTSSNLNVYSDQSQIPSWATTSIANATINKFVANYPNKPQLQPAKNATRSEAVVTMYQALRHLGRAPELFNFYIVDPLANSTTTLLSPENNIVANIALEVNSVTLFPNPLENELTIRLPESYTNEKSYIIYDLLGKKRKQGKLSSSNETINVSELNTGNYLINIFSENTRISKIITKK